MNEVVTDVIHDCRDHIHFSRKIFQDYWSMFDDDVKDMINTLNEKVFNQFRQSIEQINITADINLLIEFMNEVNRTNIAMLVNEIKVNLDGMNILFSNITNSNSTLSPKIVQSTVAEVCLNKMKKMYHTR